MRVPYGAAFAAIVLLLTGCRGGSPTALLPGSQGALGSAAFTVQVPGPADATATIPASITVSVTSINGTRVAHPSMTTMNLTAQTRGCNALAGGALTCVATASAPQGRDTFVISTYAGPNGTGAQLSTAQTVTTVQAGKTTKCGPKGAIE